MLARSITGATLAAALLASAGGMCAVSHADTCVPKLNGAAQACTYGLIQNVTNDKVIRLTPMDNSPPPKSRSTGPTPAGWAVEQLENDGATLLVPPLGSAQIFGLTHLELDRKATREQSAATSLCNASGLCKYLDPNADFRECVMGMAAAADNRAQMNAATLWAETQTARACKKAVDDMNEKDQEAKAAAASEAARKAAAERAEAVQMERIPDLYKSALDEAVKPADVFGVLEVAAVDVARK